MSFSLNQAHEMPGTRRLLALLEGLAAARWRQRFFWSVVVLVLVAALLMRLYHLALPFDRDSYDEGVYWQSLRAMQAGQGLYRTIFYSQPPLFLLSTYPGFVLFGASLWSARFGVALVSLLGFLGAYLLGRALAGRVGALVALLLLLVDPFYLMQSQTIQAEASSVAFTLLALALAFLWWEQPDGWRGAGWAALCGLAFALSLLCKLLCIATIVPLALLLLARAWQIARGKPGTSRQSWWPLLIGAGVALLTILLGVLPYAGSFKDFWAGVWTFHAAAAKTVALSRLVNLQKIREALLSVLTLAALYGALAALLRRDWRVLPLLAWLGVTFLLLLNQQPLFLHHLIALEPPLIALALLGLARPARYEAVLSRFAARDRLARVISAGAVLLILVACLGGAWRDVNYYQGADAYAASPFVQQNMRVANDLRLALKPGQWVVTDDQFIAGLADRSTPPELVDTSSVRLLTGYLTLAQLEQITGNPRVHAVLFYTGRFYSIRQIEGFHAWVAAHFRLLRRYSPSQELWVRSFAIMGKVKRL